LKDKIIFRNTVWVSNLKALDSSFESTVPLKELQQQQKVQLAKKVFYTIKKVSSAYIFQDSYFLHLWKAVTKNTAVASFVKNIG
jgi:hypothetical protein